MLIIFLSLLFILHRSRLCSSRDCHLIYAEHAKDFIREEDGPVKENRLVAVWL